MEKSSGHSSDLFRHSPLDLNGGAVCVRLAYFRYYYMWATVCACGLWVHVCIMLFVAACDFHSLKASAALTHAEERAARLRRHTHTHTHTHTLAHTLSFIHKFMQQQQPPPSAPKAPPTPQHCHCHRHRHRLCFCFGFCCCCCCFCQCLCLRRRLVSSQQQQQASSNAFMLVLLHWKKIKNIFLTEICIEPIERRIANHNKYKRNL